MPGRGRPPKDPDKRARRNADAVGWTEIDPAARPAKPPALPGASSFSARTRRWYKTWAESPQATTFLATDWQRLHMLAPLIDRYFEAPSQPLLAEIRLQESSLGATVVDRQRARMALTSGAPAAASGDPSTGSSSRSGPDPRKLQVVK